jgi:hypothetical protein
MTRYMDLYCKERDAHDVTKRRLEHHKQYGETLGLFIRQNGLQDAFTCWLLDREAPAITTRDERKEGI